MDGNEITKRSYPTAQLQYYSKITFDENFEGTLEHEVQKVLKRIY